MKTKDHRLLGEFLLKNTSLFPGKKERTFFLFGCVEPDYNPFTYLLGFLSTPSGGTMSRILPDIWGGWRAFPGKGG